MTIPHRAEKLSRWLRYVADQMSAHAAVGSVLGQRDTAEIAAILYEMEVVAKTLEKRLGEEALATLQRIRRGR